MGLCSPSTNNSSLRKSDAASEASSFYYWITLCQTLLSNLLPWKWKASVRLLREASRVINWAQSATFPQDQYAALRFYFNAWLFTSSHGSPQVNISPTSAGVHCLQTQDCYWFDCCISGQLREMRHFKHTFSRPSEQCIHWWQILISDCIKEKKIDLLNLWQWGLGNSLDLMWNLTSSLVIYF